MSFLKFLLGLFTRVAHAANIEQLGSGSPGIDAMWADLKSIFPHTDYGSGGLGFAMLLATNIILRFIGGIAVLMIVYGGIRMMLTVNNESAHEDAKKIVIYALLGLVLVIATDAIVLYAMNLLKLATGG
jgi:hypothetical protein